jgi:protein-S-isoprenylcysteine O-methyltransferase Ste14
MAVTAAALLAVCGFVWGIYALRTFDLFGLRPIRDHLRGTSVQSPASPPGATELVVRGPYRLVRHPLYSCVIVLLWADPEMNAGQLLFAVMWTAWIYAGALLEERDLMAEFGDSYRQYRRQVPILIPWRGRMAKPATEV